MPPKKRLTKAKSKPARRTTKRRQYGGERVLTEEELMREATHFTTDNPYAQPAPKPTPLPRNDYYLQPSQTWKWFAPPALNLVQGRFGDAWDMAKEQFSNFKREHKQAKTVSNALSRWGLTRLANWTRSKGWGKKKTKKKTKKKLKGGARPIPTGRSRVVLF